MLPRPFIRALHQCMLSKDNSVVILITESHLICLSHLAVHFLLKVKATDADGPEFGTLHYSLSDGFDRTDQHPLFQIHPQTGELCVSQDIDRDSGHTVYDILVKAEDPVSKRHLSIQNYDSEYLHPQ